jgi:hypothetical protein
MVVSKQPQAYYEAEYNLIHLLGSASQDILLVSEL